MGLESKRFYNAIFPLALFDVLFRIGFCSFCITSLFATIFIIVGDCFFFVRIVRYIVSDSLFCKRDYDVLYLILSFQLQALQNILHIFVTVDAFFSPLFCVCAFCSAFFRKIYFYCTKLNDIGMRCYLNRIENIVGHTLPTSSSIDWIYLYVCICMWYFCESVHIHSRYVVKVRKYL